MDTAGRQRYGATALHGFARSILVSAGMEPAGSGSVADALIQADCRGAASHGLIRLPFLVKRLVDGGANPRPVFRVVGEAPATAVVDADAALGPVAAEYAMRLASAKATDAGIGAVTVRNSDFIGTCAHSAMIALEAGHLGMTWTNGHPGMAPWGGRANALGNNPLAWAIPGGSGAPVVLDIAMSVVAGGKVRHASKTGKAIPEGWVVDAAGNDTTRPEDFPEGGALLAMGHKGYGLAVIGEILGGALAGAAMLGGVSQWFTATDRPTGNGHFHLAIDPDRFIGRDDFNARMDHLRETIRQTPRRPGIEAIVLPGEGAAAREKAARADGVALPREVAADLEELSMRFDVEMPTVMAN
ncbi:Ldh family oxidoreductase [Pararhizobium haloflavum]|uniref:Ldh family oxidoreductase n=1 Tax=Pararhizobium haloflavum TaxID=2037914 RepID=UPI000C1773A2|nr:Ldh family oxidoreductase [Pararhizobium haloflavum]